MKSGECGLTCHCGEDADYCDSIPDSNVPSGHAAGECGYRLEPLCWFHAVERKRINTSRIQDVLTCPGEGVARIDRGRAGGDCVCPDCLRPYYSHRPNVEHPFMTQLCDGSLVKL